VVSTTRFSLRVGGLSREELMGALDSADVLLNAHASALLGNPVFDERAGQEVVIVQRTVGELGLADGAVLTDIFAAAQA